MYVRCCLRLLDLHRRQVQHDRSRLPLATMAVPVFPERGATSLPEAVLEPEDLEPSRTPVAEQHSEDTAATHSAPALDGDPIEPLPSEAADADDSIEM